jgi:hypothetical protein
VALCQARTSTKPLWGLSSSNPYHPSHVPNNESGHFLRKMLCPYLTCGRGALQGLLFGELTSERAYKARQERLHFSPHLQKNSRRTLDEIMFQNNVKQCCGSRMFVPDPDSYPSRIPDPGPRIQKQQ